MLNSTLTVEQRILKQRAHIMRDDRFIAIAGIMMIGKWSVVDTETLPNGQPYTACTNGRDEFYGRKFIESLDDLVLRFVILHETYHKMFMHLTMWKHLFDKNPNIANAATDIVINNLLDNQAGANADGFLTIWPNAWLRHEWDGLDTGEVFRKLVKESKGGGGGGGGESGKGTPGAGAGASGQAMDYHDTDGDADGAPPLTPEEVKELHDIIDTTLRQSAQMAGRTGAKIDRSITDLLESTTRWEDELQDFIKTTATGVDLATWRKPSRRWLTREVYQPSRYTEAVKCIALGIDTSGSIGPDQLRRAMSEIKSACDAVHPETVHVIYWDAEVAGHETYEHDAVESLVNCTKPVGGGGTYVGSMRQYMEAKNIVPDAIIIFTDGYVEADWGGTNWPAPVLWAISTKGKIAPHGKSIYVPVE